MAAEEIVVTPSKKKLYANGIWNYCFIFIFFFCIHYQL